VDDGIPVIRGANLPAECAFLDQDFVFVREKKADELAPNNAHRGDLVFTQRGTLGQVGLIPESARYDRYVISQSQMKLTVDPKVAHAPYVYYFFRHPVTVQTIHDRALTSGVPHINLGILKRLEMPLPPLEHQTRIASILSAYDDLIENNTRRIALLEQAARHLYDEWFVRLKFPGHERTRIVNGVPEGWKKTPFSALANFVNGYPFKPDELGSTGLPIVKIPEIRDGVTEKTPRNEGENIPSKYMLKDTDLLFSWSGTLLIDFWHGGPAILNQHLFRVEPNGLCSAEFLLLALRIALPLFTNQTIGATMKHIRKGALTAVTTTLPTKPVLEQFDVFAAATYRQVLNLYRQNQKLRTARDHLLPRLMNGEIAA
jgi:type I restriction enzyme S subunit